VARRGDPRGGGSGRELEHGHVASALADELLNDPTCPERELSDFLARGEEDLVPGRGVLPVADAKPLDAAHPAARPVPLLVATRKLRGLVVRVVRAREDPPFVGGEPGELPKQPAPLLLARKEAEVVSEQQEGVESLTRPDRTVERSEPHVAQATLPRDLHGQG
jgi:hypothetical protein